MLGQVDFKTALGKGLASLISGDINVHLDRYFGTFHGNFVCLVFFLFLTVARKNGCKKFNKLRRRWNYGAEKYAKKIQNKGHMEKKKEPSLCVILIHMKIKVTRKALL